MSEVMIFGAGLAGLIAARMLADRKPDILEKQSSLPNNHQALLRFRSSVVGDVCNIPFKKVSVIKAVEGSTNPVADAIRYSLKVSGKIQSRSILDLATVERYIAPPTLVSSLASTVHIAYDIDFVQWSHELIRASKPKIISTIPMPTMMEIFGWEPLNFRHVQGWTYRAEIAADLECSANATIYFPGDEPWYRGSITGSSFILEGVGDPPDSGIDLREASIKSFGMKKWQIFGGELYRSKYQKIAELSAKDRETAKRFIMWLSEEHGIYSLGRYATWRPKLLLDDIVNDVRVIRRLMDGGSNYEAKLRT